MLLRSYDDPAGKPYDLIFSIEALVHSQDLARCAVVFGRVQVEVSTAAARVAR